MYCGMLLSLAKLIYPSVRLQDQTFELHMICGVNDCVSGPVGSCHIFYHSHVNFVASTEFPRGSASSVLFLLKLAPMAMTSPSVALCLCHRHALVCYIANLC